MLLCTISMEDFNKHICKDFVSWKSVIVRQGDSHFMLIASAYGKSAA